MEDTLKIKCPNCGTILIVRKVANIESRSVTCPSCKMTQKFSDYKPHVQAVNNLNEDSVTQIAGTTKYSNTKSSVIGQLLHTDSNKPYQLKLGANKIGRKANTSTSDIEVETTDKTMSRLHSIIEVVELSTGGYKHYISNANNKNATLINGHKIENGDKLVLNDGDEVKMANVLFKFIAAEEKGDAEENEKATQEASPSK